MVRQVPLAAAQPLATRPLLVGALLVTVARLQLAQLTQMAWLSCTPIPWYTTAAMRPAQQQQIPAVASLVVVPLVGHLVARRHVSALAVTPRRHQPPSCAASMPVAPCPCVPHPCGLVPPMVPCHLSVEVLQAPPP